MNSLYAFKIPETIFVVAKTWKAARNYLFHILGDTIRFTDICGKRLRSNIEHEEGILELEVVYDRYPWWKCKCGGNSFLVLDDGSACRCRKCGRESRIKIP